MGSNKQYLDKNPNWLKIVEILRENPAVTSVEIHRVFPQYAAGTISGYMSTARKRIAEERSGKTTTAGKLATQRSRVIRRPAKAETAPVVSHTDPEDFAGVPTRDESGEYSFAARLKWVKETTMTRLADAERRRADLIDQLEALEESMRTLKKEVDLVDVMAAQPGVAEGLILELSF